MPNDLVNPLGHIFNKTFFLLLLFIPTSEHYFSVTPTTHSIVFYCGKSPKINQPMPMKGENFRFISEKKEKKNLQHKVQ